MPNENYIHTITLYNCLKASDSPSKREKWYRHTIDGCFYKCSLMDVQNGTQATKSSAYTVRIPQNGQYKSYREWKNLSDEERQQCFTFSSGDIVVHGECTENIGEGKAAAQLLAGNKPDAFKITAVADNSGSRFAKHYRLGG